jgi:hypothetical protein
MGICKGDCVTTTARHELSIRVTLCSRFGLGFATKEETSHETPNSV